MTTRPTPEAGDAELIEQLQRVSAHVQLYEHSSFVRYIEEAITRLRELTQRPAAEQEEQWVLLSEREPTAEDCPKEGPPYQRNYVQFYKRDGTICFRTYWDTGNATHWRRLPKPPAPVLTEEERVKAEDEKAWVTFCNKRGMFHDGSPHRKADFLAGRQSLREGGEGK